MPPGWPISPRWPTPRSSRCRSRPPPRRTRKSWWCSGSVGDPDPVGRAQPGRLVVAEDRAPALDPLREQAVQRVAGEDPAVGAVLLREAVRGRGVGPAVVVVEVAEGSGPA